MKGLPRKRTKLLNKVVVKLEAPKRRTNRYRFTVLPRAHHCIRNASKFSSGKVIVRWLSFTNNHPLAEYGEKTIMKLMKLIHQPQITK